ncbi:hypothetical protein ACFL2X_00045 [Candidatus Latescibacterota bacterium]
MRITGPDAGSGDKIPVPRPAGKNREMQLNTVVRPQNSTIPGDRLTKHLSGFFAKSGMDILPSQIKALHAELSALGLGATDIDETVILNALVLRRHSIPLSKELLEILRGNAPVVFRGISSLSEDAMALLGDSRLTGENRSAVEALLRDINVLFKGTVPQESSAIVMETALNAQQLKHIIQNSGMAFEWQLLAWYRSGRDPERLRALMREDLKGILSKFANRAKKNPAKGKVKKKFELLEKNTQTQLKNIRNLQLSNIFGKHGLKKGFCLELPPCAGLKHGQGIIEDTGPKDSGEKEVAETRKSFTLEIDVETSKIGNVHVGMTFAGKAVSLNFGFESETISTVAKDMSGELRANLTEQGYTVAAADFHKRGSIAKRSKDGSISEGNGKSAKNLDITG